MAFVTILFVERKIRFFEITPFFKVQGEGLLLLGVIIFCNAIFPRTAQQLSLESVYYLLRDVFFCVFGPSIISSSQAISTKKRTFTLQ